MRALATTAALFSLTLAGCSGEAPSAPATIDSELPELSRWEWSATQPRPIVGRCETSFNRPPFPPPPVHNQADTGVCWISHLGRTQVVSQQDINFAAGTQTGSRTFTAANGDKLYATHVGTSALTAPGRVGFSATLTFTGGTGRFEHATGQAFAKGEANQATATASFIMAGLIVYDASNRGIERDR